MGEKKVGLRMAKASEDETLKLLKILQWIEHLLKKGVDDKILGTFVRRKFGKHARGYERVIFGYLTLVDNVCDPNLNYLEFKPGLGYVE